MRSIPPTKTSHTPLLHAKKAWHRPVAVVIGSLSVASGLTLLAVSLAAGVYALANLSDGTLGGGAKVVTEVGGGSAVLFSSSPSPTPSPSTPTPVPSTPSPTPSGPFTLAWSANFSTNEPLGSFGNCTENSCPNIPGWGAYPSGWPDTATERGGYAVGGYYDPGTTTWISGGQMHIKLWRGSSGSIHSDSLVPLAAFDKTYGKYVETFKVSQITTGYKSAHLLYSTGNQNDEIDYPEAQLDDSSIYAYIHYREANLPQQSFNSNVDWTSWHTSEVDWTPGQLKFYMDRKIIGSTTTGISSTPMKWVIQNESALNGESAPVNSSAQMDISSVAYYTYN